MPRSIMGWAIFAVAVMAVIFVTYRVAAVRSIVVGS